MRYFLNISIKWKLMLGFSIGVIALILVAGTAIFTMTSLRDTQVEIQNIQLNNVIDYQALDANLTHLCHMAQQMLIKSMTCNFSKGVMAQQMRHAQ